MAKQLADYKQLINTVQRHTRCSDSCLRKRRSSNQFACRYHFPKPLVDQSRIIQKENGAFDIELKRNDDRMNGHISTISSHWRANIDFKPVLSIDTVLNYLAKYASKPESPSTALSQMGTILEQLQTGNRTSTSLLQSILIKQCALRDYSAQEAMWRLTGFPLMRCSKQFKILNLADDSFLPFEEGDGEFVSNDPETVYGNRIQRFRVLNLNREALQEVEQMSMYEFFSTYYLRTATASTFSRYRNAPVLRIFPRPNSAEVHGNLSDQFCKLQLKLPVSWSGRFEESVNPGRRLWVEIYREHSEQIPDFLALNFDEIEEDDEFE